MELVVLYYGLVLIIVLVQRVHSTHELLLLVNDGHLAEEDGGGGELVGKDVVCV